jgi:Flp pilus assembly protein TadD
MIPLLKALWKPLLILLILFIVIYTLFRVHVLLGVGVILLLIGLALYTSRSNIYAFRGNRAFMNKETEQALQWYQKATRCKPCPDKHKIAYGYLLMRSGERSQAEEVFSKLLQQSSNRETLMQAKCNLATCYWLQGKKDEAVALLEEVFEQYKNTLVYGNLGFLKILHGDLNEALAINQEAYSYNSDDITIMDNLALNYYLLDEIDKAHEIYQKLIPKSPRYAEPYYYYALTLNDRGEHEAAVEQINQALEKDISFLSPLTREELEQEAARLKPAESFNA